MCNCIKCNKPMQDCEFTMCVKCYLEMPEDAIEKKTKEDKSVNRNS